MQSIGTSITSPTALPDKAEVYKSYKIKIIDWNKIKNKFDVAILAVPHKYYKSLGIKEISKKIKKNGLLIDVKNIYNKEKVQNLGLNYLTL